MIRKFSHHTGFLLVEALIGLLVGTVLMTVFTYTVGHSLHSIALSRQRMDACLLAQSSLDQAFMTMTGEGGTRQTSKNGFSVTVSLKRDVLLKRLVRGTVSVTSPQISLTMRTGRCL